MLKQQYRFHGYGSLKYLYRRGKTFRMRSLSLRVVYNERRKDSRVTVIVTKKVIKAAPKRNRLRRRVYEVVRTNWDHIKPSYDLLISVHDPQVLIVPYSELEKSVIAVLKQAGVWQDV